MKEFVKLPKLAHGDQVAIISPSSGLAGLFPWVTDLGLVRLREQFGLTTTEYPTTRQMGSSLQDRARDIMAAFADPDNKAVIASIGGEDQIQLIKYLDKQVFLDNPKPFFGYSDNTHLHNFLWNLGIPSYYGGCVMTQYAMQGAMHQITLDFLRLAFFETDEFEMAVSKEFNDEGLNWSDKENLGKTRKMEPNDGLFWDGTQDAKGVLWGGCVESLIVQAATGKYLPSSEDLQGTILYIETAEDIPDHWIPEYLLMGFGERGWFDKFQAVIVGRPKAWEFDKQKTVQEKAEYRNGQREVILKTIRQYNKVIPVVQNLDFGHTDPQICLPSGGSCQIDTTNKKIYLAY